MSDSRNVLSPGHRLHWYVIKRVLGQGGFGITYLAEDSNLGRDVAIKEYLPTGMAVRDSDSSVQPLGGEQGEMYAWGLDRFISEAQTLARFKHANIVHVYSVFSENNTAYMVMEYEQGRGLDDVLKEHKTLAEDTLKMILIPLLDGLEQVHAVGFIHRDIKPANIFIRKDGSPVLLDFGSARQSLGEQTRTLTAMVSPGFAPFEQYTSKGDRQGPWTDIYGLGATLYRAVTGKSPPNAMDRSEALLHASRDIYVPAMDIRPPGYSLTLLNAIDKALIFKPGERPQSIADWRISLTGEVMADVTATTTKPPDVDIPVKTDKLEASAIKDRKSVFPWRWTAVTAILAIFIVIFVQGINRVRQSDHSPRVSSQPAPQVSESNGSAGSLKGEPANKSPATVSDNPARNTAPAASGQASELTALLDESDRRRLQTLRQRLQRNDSDTRARAELQTLLDRYEEQVRVAMGKRDYEQVEQYLQDMLSIAPDNDRLKESLERIRSLRRQQ